MVATKPLKFAVGVRKDRSEVWRRVAEAQSGLAAATAQRVSVSASVSSLPLTLKSPPVEDAVKGYIKALSHAMDGKSGVIGFAFAVNGEVNSADVYSSPELFAAMWPKLLKASAVEAVRLKRKEPFAAIEAATVDAFLRDSGKGAEAKIDVDRRITLVRRESEQQVTMESQDRAGWIHRSMIKK